jgi:hypothetical protein
MGAEGSAYSNFARQRSVGYKVGISRSRTVSKEVRNRAAGNRTLIAQHVGRRERSCRRVGVR